MRFSYKIIFCAILMATNFAASAQITALADEKEKRKSNVTIIPITDSSMIPAGAIIKRAIREVDSSRFVERKKIVVQDERNMPRTASHVRVDPALYGVHTDFITKYIENYHVNHASRLSRIKHQNRSHFSFIDNVFKKYNVPKELKALAVIESAMNFQALSPVGARGPWQFMPETGKLLGLRVDERVDERIDFYKSTKAAAQYLVQINRMFNNDWLLTVAGYNWGPGNITRVLNKTKGDSYWDIKDLLPRETRNHVMAFIATATYLENNSTALALGRYPYGIKAPQPNFGAFASAYDDNPTIENGVITFKEGQPKIAPSEMDDIAILKVKGAYQLDVISKQLDFDITTLRRWNPAFDTEIISADAPIYLRIPVDKLEMFILKKGKIVRESRAFIDKNTAASN